MDCEAAIVLVKNLLIVLLQARVKISGEAISFEYEIRKTQKRADLPFSAIGNTFRS